MLPGFTTKVIRAIAVMVGVITLTFLLLHLAPGDPVLTLLGPTASPAQIAATRHAMGLDQPLVAQYFRWVGQALIGDFGTSIATGRPVGTMLAEAWPATAILAGLSIALSNIFGLLLASAHATTKRPLFRGLFSGLSIGLASLPGYWLAFVLVMLFAYQLRWLPAFGASGLDSEFLTGGSRLVDRLAHLVLPLVTLTAIGIGTIAHFARGTIQAVGNEPYLMLAKAKGLPRPQIFFRHHLRNGLIPVLAILGLQLPAIFSGTVFVEGVFAWPGVGTLLIQAVRARDYPVVMAATTVSAILVILGGLLAERLVRFADPRSRG